ncbi:hypothetical protein LEP1GSC060_1712 [Leptospira weilii serovar Ranarum str. ICFT]|uniref:Uncharacterized protein n=1 Tax=Leptospira weilii serovar Ranarum str. ICFT TaxID=1218598 RepID=N1WLQ2_9LEPT|nr:hypothetical protein LEP1GSC060_1712 [Leptospira weilii serovar Ranarum str. ICFT]
MEKVKPSDKRTLKKLNALPLTFPRVFLLRKDREDWITIGSEKQVIGDKNRNKKAKRNFIGHTHLNFLYLFLL